MAIKSMFEVDYFLGIWSRGRSKSFTTGIYAYGCNPNQGVEIEQFQNPLGSLAYF